MRIAAIADLHCRAGSTGQIDALLAGVNEAAEVLLLAGDLTDTGQPAEMDVLLKELEDVRLPIVAVLGNHDHESDEAPRLVELLTARGVSVLEGSVCEIGGTGFVGTKGFCGGFEQNMVQPFGERALKTFIHTAIDESLALENALARLDCPHKVAVLHYSPVKETLAGESPELFAFLGSSRLASALDRRGVDAIVHGHAHHGAPSGRTPRGTPVYNVSRFVLSRNSPRAYCVFEV